MAKAFYIRLRALVLGLKDQFQARENECPYWAEDGQSEDIRALRF